MTDNDATAESYDDEPAQQRLAVSPWAVGSFALAALALLLYAYFGGILALVAVIMGHAARHDISRGLKAGRNWALSGLILGYFVLVIATLAYIRQQ